MRRLRDPSNARMLATTIVAIGFFLCLPTPALADDWGVLVADGFVMLATMIAGCYAFVVMIALLFKVFRSPAALYTSFVLSAIASIAFVLALLLEWEYLPRGDEFILYMLLLDGVLLFFVWVAPPLQYHAGGTDDFPE